MTAPPRTRRRVPRWCASILGTRSEQPFAFAPTGFTRLMHHDGERAAEILAGEVHRTMQLLGVQTSYELGPQHMTRRDHLLVRTPQ